ncbi:glycosyltransferase [Pokkaliibacter sp. CJK22405]|uniref:glycosyltransferase n=1 Tax=Pokkaliibacter sp. CJK22405 TaxID=3384615 RepID=UPI0039855465
MANKQFICMKWGTLYGAEYVNRLYAMARQQTTGPIRFVCLTDDTSGIREEVECYDCPTIPLPDPQRRLGWRKLTLYRESEHLFGLTGDWLYLDLDVVVSGSLDDFFTFQPEKTFVVMQNWTQPGKRIGNTSVYRFRVGADAYLYDQLVADHAKVFGEFRNSQTYISRNVKDLTFWPDAWCVLFKTHCVPAWPQRFWQEPVLPETAKVVAFPGDPNPHDAVVGRWPVKKPYKRLYKFIRPATWIDRIWNDAERASRMPE